MEQFKKLFIINCTILLLVLKVHAQVKYDYTWALGISDLTNPASLIRFNDTGIVSIDSSSSRMRLDGDGSIICDAEGKLKLVFKNCFALNESLDTLIGSYKLRNKSGTISYCNRGGGQYPFDQSTIIIPSSLDSNKYHLIFVDGGFLTEEQDSLKALDYGRLFVQSVDFSLDSRGEVLGERVELLKDSITPGMITACYKNSSSNWWIMARLDGTPCYSLLSLDRDSFSFVRRMCFGSDLTGRNDISGSSEFSPNRKYYAHYLTGNGIYVFNFNDVTGELSNYRKIDKYGIDNYYGRICFSPDSKLLYLFSSGHIIQFDLLSADINQSGIIIDSFKFDPMNENFASYFSGKIGPDGRIYVGGLGAHKYLSVINRPNCRGADCDFRKQSIELPSRNFWGLPDSPHFNSNVRSAECPASQVTDKYKWSDIDFRFLYSEEKILLNIFNSEMQSGVLNIFDVHGMSVINKSFKYGPNFYPLDNLPAGVYFVNLYFNDISGCLGRFIKY
ncbi:MAG: hypothetical protein HOP11_14720 [Saprospiraceae bacterium]|nr:hypothetical protein [Saprospiraceae bacterium]